MTDKMWRMFLSVPALRLRLESICLLYLLVGVARATTVSTTTTANTAAGPQPSFSNGASTALSGPSYNHVKDLYTDLLQNYDTRIRPRIQVSDPVNVSISFSLTGILSFDTASQILIVWGYFQMSWMDEMMAWNPYLYNGIAMTKFPIRQIWTPTLLIASSIDGVNEINNAADKLIVAANGYVVWSPEGTYKVYCDVNIKFYPFDNQNCEILVYISDALASEVDLVDPNADVNYDYLRKNSAWKLVRIRWEKKILSGVAMFSIFIELERRRDFILYTIIAPLVLLSVLNVGVFIVPVDSGEKGSIAVTIFLSYGVFISTISDELPHNSLNISYVLIYILLLLLLSVMAVVYSYIESYIYSRHANDTASFGILTSHFRIFKVSPKSLPQKGQETGDDSAESFGSETDKSYETKYNRLTWNVLMKKIDTIVFLFFFLFVVIATCVFLIGLSQTDGNVVFGSS